MISSIALVLTALHLIVGLLTVVAAAALLKRPRVDPGVKVLLVWGAWTVVTGVWNLFGHLVFSRPTPSLIPLLNGLSWVFGIGGTLLLYAIALYAVWRFWRGSK
ncbi:MAG: hypothetical protein ACM3XM_03460 [Mycobacterium leprae]